MGFTLPWAGVTPAPSKQDEADFRVCKAAGFVEVCGAIRNESSEGVIRFWSARRGLVELHRGSLASDGMLVAAPGFRARFS
jgi:hypothetical protein